MRMQDNEFEWDDAKANSNLAKHNVSFEIAREAFQDPNWVELDDDHPDESRYRRVCAYEGRIYVVVYTERGSRTRIISARRANRYDRSIYADQQSR